MENLINTIIQLKNIRKMVGKKSSKFYILDCLLEIKNQNKNKEPQRKLNKEGAFQ